MNLFIMSSFQISESSALQNSGVETQVVAPAVSTVVVLGDSKYEVVLRKLSISSDDMSEVFEGDGVMDVSVSPCTVGGDVEMSESAHFTVDDLADFAASMSLEDVKPAKPLRKEVKPFIPAYHSNMTLQQVDEVASMEGVSEEDLFSRGYPRFLISRLSTCKTRKSVLNPFKETVRDRHEVVDLYSSEVPSLSTKAAKTRSAYDVGEVARYWVIPNRYEAKIVGKPTRYSRRTFHAWCLGKARYFYTQELKKTQIVTGNSACRALYFSSDAMTQRVADQLLQKAEVYVEDFGVDGKSVGALTLGHFTDSSLMKNYNYFMIGNVQVSNVEEALQFEPLFKRHGPIFRRLISALQGDVTVDVATLQASINEKILPTKVNELLVTSKFQGHSWSDVVVTPPQVALYYKLLQPGEPIDVPIVQQLMNSIELSGPLIKKTRFQGNICPRRVTVGHKFIGNDGEDRDLTANVNVSFDVSQLASSFTAALPGGDSFVRLSTRIISFITSLVTAKDWKNVAAIVTLFVSSDPQIFNYVGNRITQALAGVTVFQGMFETIFEAISSSLSEFWEVVISSTVLAMLKEVKTSLFSTVGPVILDLVKDTRRCIGKESASVIAKSIFSWIGDIFGRLRECYRSGSMNPLWGDKWNAQTWIRYALSYERFYVTLTTSGSSPNVLKELASFRESKFIPDFWVTPKSTEDFLICCDEHLEQGNKIKDYFAGHPDVLKAISAAQGRLSQFLDGIRMMNGSRGERVAPMGFFFHGAPGVGKTNLIQQVIQSLGRLNDIPCDGKSTHLWQVGVNFQDGLNHTHSWVIMDDVDTGVAPAAAGVPTHVESVINLINHKPCPVEQADLALKGKVFASPVGVFYATNFENARATEYSVEPHAFFRRFKYFVNVKVKDKYAKEGGLLDGFKATDSDTHDMYELEVSEYKPSTQPTIFKTDPVIMSFPEFMVLCQESFSEHIKHEVSGIQRRAGANSFCPKCGLGTDKKCGHVNHTVFDEVTNVKKKPSQVNPDFVEEGVNVQTVFQGSTSSVHTEATTGANLEDEEELEDSSSDNQGQSNIAELLNSDEGVVKKGFRAEFTNPRWAQAVREGASVPLPDMMNVVEQGIPFEADFFYQVIAVEWLSYITRRKVSNVLEYKQLLNFCVYLQKTKRLPFFENIMVMKDRLPDYLDYVYIGIQPDVGYPESLPGFDDEIPKPTLRNRVSRLWQSTSRIGVEPEDWRSYMKTFAIGCAGILILHKVMKFVESVTMKSIDEMQGRECNVNGTAPIATDWQRADQKFKPGVPTSFGSATYTYQDLIKTVAECNVSIEARKEGRALGMNAVVCAPGMVIVPTHLINFSHDLKVIQNGVELEFTVPEEGIKIFSSNPQLCIIRVPNLRACPSIAKKMWFCEDATIQQFDECHIFSSKLLHTTTKAFIRACDGVNIIQTDAQTLDGECGALYLGCHNGAWKIIGMHYALDTVTSPFKTTEMSKGGLLTGRELTTLCQGSGTLFQGVQYVTSTFTPLPENLQVGRFGKYSEIWAAKSQSGVRFHPYGEMHPPLPNSSMKSKVKESVLYPHIKDIVKELNGREDYWKIPDFRGRMVEGIWRSPWTNMFASQNLAVPDPFFMKLAVYDYVNGIDLLDRSGYAELSEEQVLTGIPGSYINSLNMKTSAGPPLKGGKKAHFYLDAVEGSYASPEVWAMFDQIEQILDAGDIPSVLCVCAMKDEPLKYSKEFPRIFNVLPAAMNLVMKKHGAAWKSFMRANMQFFESAVGINMTSKDCNKVLDFLRLISPDLADLYDADAVAMDKSWSEVCFEYVALTIFIIAFSIGVSPYKNFALAKSMGHIVYSIKNDLFNVFNNPSGNDWTVELNGLLVSLGERYVYYRTKGFKGDRKVVEEWFKNIFEQPIHPFDASLDFRANVALVTYGDDNAKAMREPPSPDYEEVWAKEIGIVMTDASKLGKMRKKNVSEISFLKRDFVKLEGIQGYVARLSTFSMSRMLTMKKDSVLGDLDHSAVVLSEFFREALYHGREFYDEMLSRLVPIAEELGLTTNPYYVVKSFEERLAEAKEGNYQTWSLREPVDRVEIFTEQTFQGIMSNLKFANGSNFDPSASEADTTINHSVGVISTTSSVVQDHMNGTAKYLQNMPATDLNAVLTRATLIGDYAISNANTTGSDIAVIDPWALYLANAVVAAKLSNFSYIRGTLQVIFVTTVPGMTYGLYTATALPDGGPLVAGEVAVAPGLVTANALQGDHCAMINCSDSNSVVLQLPYIGHNDFWALPGAGTSTPVGAWTVYLRTWRALATTVSGGVTTGRVQVYANLIEDYSLAVPRFQGKHKLIANDALKRMAPKVHETIGEGKGSKMMGAIADVAESVSSLPVIGAFASTAGSIARGAESVLSWFGFTVYSNEKTPIYVIQRSIGNVAHTEGDDGGFSASLSMQSEISIDPSLSGPFGPGDCLAFAELFPRWTHVKTLDWPTTATSQTDLGMVPVSPFYCLGTGTSVNLTTAGYAGLPFDFWRGDMEYMLVIPVASTHRGKLQVFWTPQGSNATGDVTNVSYNAIFDVAAGPMKTISIGFAREKPFLRNTIISDSLTLLPIGDANGSLQFRVINPLTSSSVTAGTTIYVFARAKANMEFAVPRDFVRYRNTAGTALFNYSLQAHTKLQGALGDDDSAAAGEESISVVPDSGEFPSDLIYFGEKVKSCRELLQKPSKLSAIVGINSTYQVQSPFPAPQSTVTNSFVNVWTWQGHYRSMFYGLAFSERWKVLTKFTCWVGAARGQYVDTYDILPTMSPITNTTFNNGSEFRLPYYLNQKFLRGHVSTSAQAALQVSKLTVAGESSLGSQNIDSIWYYSWGPDIRATCFRQVPTVTFTETPVTGFKSLW